jgi:hypothetical protein
MLMRGFSVCGRVDPGCHLMPETTGYAGVNNKGIAE